MLERTVVPTGLRYVTDTLPGIKRKRAGKGFSYHGSDGKPIRDQATLRRIRSLAVPPAYENVWIAPIANAHLQATARDARGRKQYRYHQRWREARDEAKFDRMAEFSKTLPVLRRRVDHDLALPDLPREKVLATVVRLLELTLVRVGNDEYAKANRSFGLTTLRDRHVRVDGSVVHFQFRGKSGRAHAVDVCDRRLAAIVRRLVDIPGQELFEYIDDAGAHHAVHSHDVNEYLREATGGDYTAKDFRTLAATVLCAAGLSSLPRAATAKEAKENVATVIRAVADRLGNTPAVCRKAYVHPLLPAEYLAGSAIRVRPNERAVVRLIERLTRKKGAR